MGRLVPQYGPAAVLPEIREPPAAFEVKVKVPGPEYRRKKPQHLIVSYFGKPRTLVEAQEPGFFPVLKPDPDNGALFAFPNLRYFPVAVVVVKDPVSGPPAPIG
jgi:hypothetical protein